MPRNDDRLVQLAWIIIARCRPLTARRRLLLRRTCVHYAPTVCAAIVASTQCQRDTIHDAVDLTRRCFFLSVTDGVLAEITMTMDVSKSETSKNGTTQHECAGCGKTITER